MRDNVIIHCLYIIILLVAAICTVKLYICCALHEFALHCNQHFYKPNAAVYADRIVISVSCAATEVSFAPL